MNNPLPSASTAPASPESQVIFRAFQERASRRGRWVALVLVPLLAFGLWAVAAKTGQERRPLPAPVVRGYQGVRQGMTLQEVQGVMGKPFAVERSHDGRADCYQYGHPTFEKAEFPVYSLCYEDGRLRDSTVRRFTLQQVGPGGTPSAVPADDSAESKP